MMRLVFILGREPEISIAEIAAVVGDAGDWSGALIGREALVVSIESRESGVVSREIIQRLGGTVKVGELIMDNTECLSVEALAKVDGITKSSSSSIEDQLAQFVIKNTEDNGKTCFGFSVHDLGGGMKAVLRERKRILRTGPTVKRLLREAGRSARWVTSREATLSSVVVVKNKLLSPDGVEFLVLVAPDRIIIARTLAVQPFEEWGSRDYGRPARNMERGMLPPKLARIMVNLATVKNAKHEARNSKQARSTKFETPGSEHSNFEFVSDFDIRYSDFTILDPFCGTGTVLMEAMRLGHSVLGSDIDPKAITETRENICWMQRTGVCAPQEPRLAAIAAEHVGSHVGTTRVDAIVTEPYLGPIQASGISNRASQIRLIQELRTLYLAAFREFAKVLKPHGRVVFITPAFRERAVVRAVEIAADIEQLGFRIVSPFPKELASQKMIHDAQVLEYARPDQRVIRRFLIAERT